MILCPSCYRPFRQNTFSLFFFINSGNSGNFLELISWLVGWVVSFFLFPWMSFCLLVYTRLLLRLPMPSPLYISFTALYLGGKSLPSYLTLTFAHCFLSVICCLKTVHFHAVNRRHRRKNYDIGESPRNYLVWRKTNF